VSEGHGERRGSEGGAPRKWRRAAVLAKSRRMMGLGARESYGNVSSGRHG
jgi:hypothetical protein